MPKSIDQIARETAQRYNLPYEYVRGLIRYESKDNPNAKSPTGARGLAQFTKSTGRAYGLDRKNITDPEANVDAAGRFARDNFKAFQRRMGRDPTADELYLTHLQGAGGATSGLRNPDELAINIFGRKATTANLPRSMRGQLGTITAKEFQDVHRGNFNRESNKFRQISDTPTLQELNPNPVSRPTSKESTPLSQLAPTEASAVMARYPSYDQAINSAIDEISERGGRRFPTERLQMAGLLPPIRGPGGKMRANPMNTPKALPPSKGLPKPEDVPGVRTAPTTISEAEARVQAHNRQRALQEMKARVQRGEMPVRAKPGEAPTTVHAPAPEGSAGAAPIPGSTPIRPAPTGQQFSGKISPAYPAAAVPAAAAGGAMVGGKDPAVTAVEQAISPDEQFYDPGSGLPMTRGQYDRRPPAQQFTESANNPNNVGGIIQQQVAPVIQEVQKNPREAQVVQQAAVVLTKAKARVDAATQFQQDAARRQVQPGGGGGGDPIADRAMERAVMMDNARRSPSMGMPAMLRGIQNGPPPTPPAPVGPQSQMTPPMQPPQQMAGGMDPSMASLMQFFTGGGGGVG